VRIAAVVALACAVVATAAAATEATRKPAPALTGVTLDGKQLSLAKLRGKPVFVNVWASW
jgi:cytochrome c biogenesis protein CcmG, thiol:disulfide interchange protein DsbE